MNEEIKKANEQIIINNDITEQTIIKLLESLSRMNENFNSMKTSLNEKIKPITNPDAVSFFLKVQKDLIDLQVEINKTISKVKKEQESSRTKIFEKLYADPDEDPKSLPEGGKKEETEAKNAL